MQELPNGKAKAAFRLKDGTATAIAAHMNVVKNGMAERTVQQQNVGGPSWNTADETNEDRRAEGGGQVVSRPNATIGSASLEAPSVALGRAGADAGRTLCAPVGHGADVHRPLQRVEIGEWETDAISLLAGAGVLETLTYAEIRQLGLDAAEARWTVTVAMCARTRCIVGMMISPEGDSTGAARVIEMILHDKGTWSDAVGALRPWTQHGVPEAIVMDRGVGNISREVLVRMKDAGVTVLCTPEAAPRMRAFFGRVFLFIAPSLRPRLSGRTFSDVIPKADHGAGNQTDRSAEDLREAMVRWVVDIYHNSPYARLDGETPADCWDRLVADEDVQAPPDLRRRRLIIDAE
jgi:putative transposase